MLINNKISISYQELMRSKGVDQSEGIIKLKINN